MQEGTSTHTICMGLHAFLGASVLCAGNGFVDDIHGWAWCDSSLNPHIGDGDPMDVHGHGTHCAGIAGVVSGTAKIMALKFICSVSQAEHRVAKRSNHMSVPLLQEDGVGYEADSVHAINYAIAMGATLTSNSYGGGIPSRAREEAIRKAEEANMLFVAAAGNEHVNTDITKHYPSSLGLDSIISVGATDSNGNRACFSNYGLESVDVFAPGTDIYSTIPGGKYAYASGTSMAAPFVAGTQTLSTAVCVTSQVRRSNRLLVSL